MFKLSSVHRSLVAALLTFCAGSVGLSQYDLTIEQSAPAAAPGTVYRFYVEANDPTDKMSAVFGNDQRPWCFPAPDGIFNSALNSSWNASGVNPAFFPFFPDLQDDSFATIGLDGPAARFPVRRTHRLVQDASLPTTVSGYFQAGGTELNVNTLTGASWYVLNTAANALPTDGRWLVAQITTTGDVSGTLNAQIFPLGVGADQVQQSWDFAGGEVIILATVSLTSAAFATVLASQRVLVIALAPRLRLPATAMAIASWMWTETAFAMTRTSVFQPLKNERVTIQVDCGILQRRCLGYHLPFLRECARRHRQDVSGVRQRPERPWSSTPPTASTTTPSTPLGMHPESTRRSSGSSQTWNTTAMPPSASRGQLQAWLGLKILRCSGCIFHPM